MGYGPLAHARNLVGQEAFAAADGGYHQSSDLAQAIISRTRGCYDQPVPSGNSRMVELMARQGTTTAAEDTDELVRLARGFRRTESLELLQKNLGIFEELWMTTKSNHVMIFTIGTSVLLVNAKNHEYAKVIAVEARARHRPAGPSASS